MADGPAPQIPMAKVRKILRTPGQMPLTGFPAPKGMIAAREALRATQRPVHGPERPPGDTSAIRPNRRAHFDAGAQGEIHTFDIDYSTSKDTLKEGEVVSGSSRVTTMGKDETDARLAAEQMVAARGHEPTKVRWVP